MRRSIKREGREHIDAIAEILDGECADLDLPPLMDLVEHFRIYPYYSGKRSISKWLDEMERHIAAYRTYMDERTGANKAP